MSDDLSSRRLYFAYGSNMRSAEMEHCCPDHSFVGLGRLSGYRWLIGKRGYATLAADVSGEVLGVVYEISRADEAGLDRKEGVARGCYRKADVTVKVETSGEPVRCLTYIDDRIESAPPKAGYMDRVLDGAKARGLPAPYIAWLQGFDVVGSPPSHGEKEVQI